MEKISQIVPGNARLTSVDLSRGPASRATVPDRGMATAERAANLQTQMAEQRRSSADRMTDQIADSFFTSQVPPVRDDVVTASSFTPRGSFVDVQA